MIARRLMLVTGVILLAGPPDFAAWHHSLFGVGVVVAGAWFLASGITGGGHE